jgi:hypothetical protein
MLFTINIYLDQVTVQKERQIKITHTDLQRVTTNDLNYDGRYMHTLLPVWGVKYFVLYLCV